MKWRALNPFHVHWARGSLRAQELCTSWRHIPCGRAIQNNVFLEGITGRILSFSLLISDGSEKEEAKGRKDVRRSNDEQQREERV